MCSFQVFAMRFFYKNMTSEDCSLFIYLFFTGPLHDWFFQKICCICNVLIGELGTNT